MRVQSLVKFGAVLAAIMALLLGIGAIIAVQSLDLNRVKEMLTVQVKKATGRTLTIAGPLELQVGLVPVVAAKRVTLSNPEGSSRPDMVKIEHFEMEIALMPLLKREIVVNRLILSAPDILIETDASGPGNLDFSRPTDQSQLKPGEPMPQTAAGGDAAYRFTLNELKITHGLVSWHDRTSNKTQSLEIQELTVQADRDAAEMLAVRLLTRVRDQQIELNGTVGRADALLGGKPFPLNLKAKLEGVTLKAEGSIADLAAFKGLQIKMAAQGPELINVIRLTGATKPELPENLGPFNISAHLSDAGKQLNLTDVVAEAGKTDLMLLNAKGTIKDLAGAVVVDLHLNVASDNPIAVAKLAGAEFSGKGPMKCTGQLQGRDKSWKMAGLKASAGGSDLSGDVAVTLADRPKITGNLASATLHLVDFTAPVPTPSAAVQPTADKSAPQPVKVKGDDGRVFSDEPLPFTALPSVDADLTVQVGTLVLDNEQLTNVVVTLQLNNGQLTLKPFRFGLAGGVIEGEASLDTSKKTPAASLRMQGRQVELGKLDSKGPIIGGKSDLVIDLKGSGESVRALMASATGETSISVGEGQLRGKAVRLAGGDVLFQVLGAINPFIKSEDNTQMTCAAVRFIIRDGVATADKGIAMRTRQVDVVGSGTVDLRSERLDLVIKPRARGGVGVSFTTPLAGLVKVGGTIAKPSVGIDTAGTLRTAASVGAGFATGGLSTVGELLLERVTADEDPCRTALGQPQQGQTRQKAEPQKQSPGNILKGLFGR